MVKNTEWNKNDSICQIYLLHNVLHFKISMIEKNNLINNLRQNSLKYF